MLVLESGINLPLLTGSPMLPCDNICTVWIAAGLACDISGTQSNNNSLVDHVITLKFMSKKIVNLPITAGGSPAECKWPMDDAGPGDAVSESCVRLEEGAVSGGWGWAWAWAGVGVCTGGRGTRAAGSPLFWVRCLSQSRGTGRQPGSVYSRPNLSPVSLSER